MPERCRLTHTASRAAFQVLEETGREARLAPSATDTVEQLAKRRTRIVLQQVRLKIEQSLTRVTEATWQPVAVARVDAINEDTVEHHRLVEAAGKAQTDAPAVMRD